MPYIDPRARAKILKSLNIATTETGEIDARPAHMPRCLSPGELNFAITALIHEYVNDHDFNYATLSAALSQARCAADEFYRTVVGPYEDKKRAEHGNISYLDRTK